jgi:hypothetical protein
LVEKGGGILETVRNYQYFGGQTFKQSITNRTYTEIDPTIFNESANAFKQLMKDASKVLDSLSKSKHFAQEVMSAAQVSNTTKVDELIQSTGIQSKVDASYNPDGITMKFHAKVQDTECCQLIMNLRWR